MIPEKVRIDEDGIVLNRSIIGKEAFYQSAKEQSEERIRRSKEITLLQEVQPMARKHVPRYSKLRANFKSGSLKVIDDSTTDPGLKK